MQAVASSVTIIAPLPAPPAMTAAASSSSGPSSSSTTRIVIPCAVPSSSGRTIQEGVNMDTNDEEGAPQEVASSAPEVCTGSSVVVVTPTGHPDEDGLDLEALLSTMEQQQVPEEPPVDNNSDHDRSDDNDNDDDDLWMLPDKDNLTTTTRKNLCGNKEKVGRWTQDEHAVFLEGLAEHGKQWKVIAGLIGTRTVVQVRTHAQKYFQKVERQQQEGGDGSGATMSFRSTSSSEGSGSSAATTSTSASSKSKSSSSHSAKSKKDGNGSPKKKAAASKKAKAGRKLRITLGNKQQQASNTSNKRVVTVPLAVAATSVPNPFLQQQLPSHPSYVSATGSSGDMQGLEQAEQQQQQALISPNTITVDLVDVDQHLKLPPAPFPQPPSQQATTTGVVDQQQSSLEELAAFEGDPLEWLIETAAEDGDDNHNNVWLPESSLPYFPDLGNDDKIVGASSSSNGANNNEGSGGDVTMMAVEQQQPSAVSETMVQDAISNNMVDPNVTVQSLFLPGETNPLL